MSEGDAVDPLVRFLLDRIEEIEAKAQAATSGPWVHNPGHEWYDDPKALTKARLGERQPGGEEFVGAGPATGPGRSMYMSRVTCVAVTGPADDSQSMADASFIASQDPVVVLADCAAKRGLIAEAVKYQPGERGYGMAQQSLKWLALPYKGHHEYLAEFRP